MVHYAIKILKNHDAVPPETKEKLDKLKELYEDTDADFHKIVADMAGIETTSQDDQFGSFLWHG